MVSLKSRVRGINSLLLHLPFLIVLPTFLGAVDVRLLALLRAAAQQQNQLLAIAAEVNPVTWSPVDSVFEHAFADTLHVGKIALAHSVDGDGNLRCGLRGESVEPLCIWRAAARIEVFHDVDHTRLVTNM